MRRLPSLLILLPLFLQTVHADEQSGATVYATTCSACHAQGKYNAPPFGDRQRWKKLVAEGLDDLVPAALGGIRKMPAKGGNLSLSDAEVARAVVHMANAAGGRFAEPSASDVERWRHKADARKQR